MDAYITGNWGARAYRNDVCIHCDRTECVCGKCLGCEAELKAEEVGCYWTKGYKALCEACYLEESA